MRESGSGGMPAGASIARQYGPVVPIEGDVLPARPSHRGQRSLRALAALVLAASAVTAAGSPARADHPPEAVVPYDFACGGDVPEDGFRDVPADNVHEPAIDCAVALGLAAGTSATTYAPQAQVTRAQMATFVLRLLNANSTYLDAAAPDAFDDDNGSTHEKAVNQLAAAGLVRGTGERSYSPGAAVTRGQMAAYLVRAFERYSGVELPQALARFADVDGTTHQRSIDQAAGLGLAFGVSPTAYAPDRAVGRDQMARFLASTDGCMGVLLRDGQYHYPNCDAYTETDSARALSGFELTVATDDDHYTAADGVGVLIAACNRRDVPLRQVFPQR